MESLFTYPYMTMCFCTRHEFVPHSLVWAFCLRDQSNQGFRNHVCVTFPCSQLALDASAQTSVCNSSYPRLLVDVQSTRESRNRLDHSYASSKSLAPSTCQLCTWIIHRIQQQYSYCFFFIKGPYCSRLWILLLHWGRMSSVLYFLFIGFQS